MFDMSTAKIVSSRDSATAALRKLGINKADYDNFIAKRDGKYYVDVIGAAKPAQAAEETKAEEAEPTPAAGNLFAGLVKEPKSAKAKVTKKPAAKKQSKAKEEKPAKTSLSQTIRDMILSGKSNQQVFDELLANGTLTEAKKHYPAWYRCELRRAGHVV